MTRSEQKCSAQVWREGCRQGKESNAHRDSEWCKDIAPDVLGGLLILPFAVVLATVLYGFVLLVQGAL
jgi:hypothetical protein